MYKRYSRRCVASLLLICTLCGALSPTQVFANPLTEFFASIKGTGGNGGELPDYGEDYITTSDYNKNYLQNSDLFAKPFLVRAGVPKDNRESGDIVTIKVGKSSVDADVLPTLSTVTLEDYVICCGNMDHVDEFTKITDQVSEKIEKITDVESLKKEDKAKEILNSIYDSINTQGELKPDMSNLNQRFMALLMFQAYPDNELFYERSGTALTSKVVKASELNNNGYEKLLSLCLGYERERSLQSRLTNNDFEVNSITGLSEDVTNKYIEKGKFFDEGYVYSANNLGTLAIMQGSEPTSYYKSSAASRSYQCVRLESGRNPGKNVIPVVAPNIEGKKSFLYLANYMGAMNCIQEYLDFYEKELPEIVKKSDYKTDEVVQASLTCAMFFNKWSKFVPIIGKIYEQKNPEADNKSIKDLVEECGISEDKSLDEATTLVAKNEYVEHKDNTNLITKFYTVNSDIGIVDYDREKILGDVPVNNTLNNTISSDASEDEEFQNTTGENNGVNHVSEKTEDIAKLFLKDDPNLSGVKKPTVDKYFDDNDEIVDDTSDVDTYLNASQDFMTDLSDAAWELIKNPTKHYMSKRVKKSKRWCKNNPNSALSCAATHDTTWSAYKSDGGRCFYAKTIIVNSVCKETYLYDSMVKFIRENRRNSTFANSLEDSITYVRSHDVLSGSTSKLKKEYFGEVQKLCELLSDSECVRFLKGVAKQKKAYEFMEDTLKEETDESVDKLNDLAKKDKTAIDADGKAVSAGAVTINSYITEGVSKSAAFVPMQTNLYNEATLRKLRNDSEGTDFWEFYKHYGFLRKALYKSKSATAAVDYYTAGGKSNGELELCTLRKFLDSADKDILLYVDDSMYNAEEAVKQGNTLLNQAHNNAVSLTDSLTQYSALWALDGVFSFSGKDLVNSITDDKLRMQILKNLTGEENPEGSGEGETTTYKFEEVKAAYQEAVLDPLHFTVDEFETPEDLDEYITNAEESISLSNERSLSVDDLKDGALSTYNDELQATVGSAPNSAFVNLSDGGDFSEVNPGVLTNYYNNDNNKDSLVMNSAQIWSYMNGYVSYDKVVESEEEVTTTTYTSELGYTPLMSLAFVSSLYRDFSSYSVACLLDGNNPIFMSTKDLCGTFEANQWYRNSIFNYLLARNLKGNATIDVNYVTDLDCPLYVDIFGNILTESGTVVIPAACNATLFPGSFRDFNYAVGLWSCYGKEYSLPLDTPGAAGTLFPYFTVDKESGVYIKNAVKVTDGELTVRYDTIDIHNAAVQKAVAERFKAAVSHDKYTNYNWMAMVSIINEVLRGCPIEALDKQKENLYDPMTASGLVVTAKLENLVDALHSQMSNTMLSIPDFSRMENMEYWVALFMKLLMVATAAVIIVSIYRDGVGGKLGFKTAFNSLAAVALTVLCVVGIPAIFQLTYYSANKFLLHDEAMRILMVNEEKRQCGVELGVTDTRDVDMQGEFALQLDWVKIPWYEELETILYESTLDNLQKVKLKAYRKTATYNKPDVTLYNDGVYVTTDDLFDSVTIDYDFNASADQRRLKLYTTSTDPQTTGFYSPYYVFLKALTNNVNEYNKWRSTTTDTSSNDDTDGTTEQNYNYTTKYVSGNRCKTVGLCEDYFTSTDFMEFDKDILHLYQVYGYYDLPDEEGETYDSSSLYTDTDKAKVKHGAIVIQGSVEKPIDVTRKIVGNKDIAMNRNLLFNDKDREKFENAYWYNNNLLSYDENTYSKLLLNYRKSLASGKSAVNPDEYLEKQLTAFYSKCDAMDMYCRDYIAANKDMLTKVTDETFIKVMALNLAIKYNQLFGVASANALEIYNMNSEDLIRLSCVPSDDAVMSISLTFPRFILAYGGSPSTYVASLLVMIMWLGSFIKPICTIIVFISVFLSVFVFRVVLRRPSSNLLGYCITVGLLCATNILHALILKFSVKLPSIGLPTLGCLIFLVIGQVLYLLLLTYVTTVSLKDWYNLGATTYTSDASIVASQFKNKDTSPMLNGKIAHHKDNWEYYNDLVNQHRKRNK